MKKLLTITAAFGVAFAVSSTASAECCDCEPASLTVATLNDVFDSGQAMFGVTAYQADTNPATDGQSFGLTCDVGGTGNMACTAAANYKNFGMGYVEVPLADPCPPPFVFDQNSRTVAGAPKGNLCVAPGPGTFVASRQVQDAPVLASLVDGFLSVLGDTAQAKHGGAGNYKCEKDGETGNGCANGFANAAAAQLRNCAKSLDEGFDDNGWACCSMCDSAERDNGVCSQATCEANCNTVYGITC